MNVILNDDYKTKNPVIHNCTSSDAIDEGVNGNVNINTLNEITHDDNSSTIFVKNKEMKSSTTATAQ